MTYEIVERRPGQEDETTDEEDEEGQQQEARKGQAARLPQGPGQADDGQGRAEGIEICAGDEMALRGGIEEGTESCQQVGEVMPDVQARVGGLYHGCGE